MSFPATPRAPHAPVQCYVDKSVRDQLAKVAKHNSRSVAALLRLILEDALKAQRKIAGVTWP